VAGRIPIISPCKMAALYAASATVRILWAISERCRSKKSRRRARSSFARLRIAPDVLERSSVSPQNPIDVKDGDYRPNVRVKGWRNTGVSLRKITSETRAHLKR
jgi:hypothetical protein